MKKRLVIAALSVLIAHAGMAQVIDIKTTEDFSPYVFGHNIEHTRAAVNGGLSAQMLRNRKFAGRPSRNEGVAADWKRIGEKVFFFTEMRGYTKHIGSSGMGRINELCCQCVQNLIEGQDAGIFQDGLYVERGKEYEMRVVTKVSAPVSLLVEITDRDGKDVYSSKTLSLTPSEDWATNGFIIAPSKTDDSACVRFTFNKRSEVTFGALSMMPKDNFHGMRPDVVANLKEIGPRIIRWPGGNFAGEYRWKDGLLPVDQRGPLQAAMEIETQPYTHGFDFHEIDTDDFIALCREVGAEPMLTLNIAWNSIEETAQWVEYCNGSEDTEYGAIRAKRGNKEPYNVTFWCLGNEMGPGHMEGPNKAESYAALAEKHVDAMLKVSPGLNLFSCGPYPNDEWVVNSAARLSYKVKYISLHYYVGGWKHYTTPEDIRRSYEEIVASFSQDVTLARNMRKSLDATGKAMHISFDEWNLWASWYKPSSVAEGIYIARTLHFFINDSNALDIPVVCYFQPVGEGAILITPQGSRLTANGQMYAMMKAHQDGKVCKVSDNDDYSTAATIKDGILTISLINSEYDSDREFSFPIKGKVLDATLYSSDDVTPYSFFEESALEVKATKKNVSTVLPPHSAAIVRIAI